MRPRHGDCEPLLPQDCQGQQGEVTLIETEALQALVALMCLTDEQEREILSLLDSLVAQELASAAIDAIANRVERKLAQDPAALMAWEPVPLTAYDGGLPDLIRSSWVFVLRGHATTGAERHPNSQQRMMSYRGHGDLQVWGNQGWQSNRLVSDRRQPLEKRWLSIPVNACHQAVVPDQNWVVVSFHTVPADELIEERPDPSDTEGTCQKRYLDQCKIT